MFQNLTRGQKYFVGLLGGAVIGYASYCLYQFKRRRRVVLRVVSASSAEPSAMRQTVEQSLGHEAKVEGMRCFDTEFKKIRGSLPLAEFEKLEAALDILGTFLGDKEACTKKGAEDISKALILLFTARNAHWRLNDEFPAMMAPEIMRQAEQMLGEHVKHAAKTDVALELSLAAIKDIVTIMRCGRKIQAVNS